MLIQTSIWRFLYQVYWTLHSVTALSIIQGHAFQNTWSSLISVLYRRLFFGKFMDNSGNFENQAHLLSNRKAYHGSYRFCRTGLFFVEAVIGSRWFCDLFENIIFIQVVIITRHECKMRTLSVNEKQPIHIKPWLKIHLRAWQKSSMIHCDWTLIAGIRPLGLLFT